MKIFFDKTLFEDVFKNNCYLFKGSEFWSDFCLLLLLCSWQLGLDNLTGLIDLSFVVPPYRKFTSLQVSSGCMVPVKFVNESLFVTSSLLVGTFFTDPNSYADFDDFNFSFNGNDIDFSKLVTGTFKLLSLWGTGLLARFMVSVIWMSMFTVLGSFSSLLFFTACSEYLFLRAANSARCFNIWLCEFEKNEENFVAKLGWLKVDFNGYGVSRLLFLSRLWESLPVELLFIMLCLLSSIIFNGYDLVPVFRRFSIMFNCAIILRTSPGTSMSARVSTNCWMNVPNVATVTSRPRFWDSSLWIVACCIERVVSSLCKLLTVICNVINIIFSWHFKRYNVKLKIHNCKVCIK